MKPKNLLFLTFAIAMFLVTVTGKSQEVQEKPFIENATIENQFNFVFDKSYKFENFKSVKIPWFLTLKSHALDTIKNLKNELRKAKVQYSTSGSVIDTLRAELKRANEQLSITDKEKNSLRFLGILMGKSSYNTLVWTIILALAILLAIFILLFKRSHVVTSQTKDTLAEVKEEFETYRKRTLEREEKMARKHLDELNKYKT
jgi:hypothetical protein